MARIARSVRTETRATAILANAMFNPVRIEPEYLIDAKGRRVRKFSVANPCTRADVMELLIGVRVFDDIDALEIVGANALSYMVKMRYVVKAGQFYWITKAGAANYGLHPYFGTRTFVD